MFFGFCGAKFQKKLKIFGANPRDWDFSRILPS
jgi:hypothetical protein